MRTALALGLSISLCTSALAATPHHPSPRRAHLRSLRSGRRLILRSDQAATSHSGFTVPGWSDEETEYWMDHATMGTGIPATRPSWLDHATTPNGLDVSRPNRGSP
jgi:hypothetical protein